MFGLKKKVLTSAKRHGGFATPERNAYNLTFRPSSKYKCPNCTHSLCIHFGAFKTGRGGALKLAEEIDLSNLQAQDS
eukprot:3812373-Amphidinium_carterae.1